MKGCSPGWYCDDDDAIFVEFKLDKDGRKISSDVSKGWLSCL